MNLLELRTKLIDLSGRFDLVTDAASGDYSDNGANFFIFEGQKHLDRMNETQKSWASVFRFIDTGFFSAGFPYCRAIKEVWISNTVSRWQLEKKDLNRITSEHLSNLPSTRSNGSPRYFSPMITRYIPEDADLSNFEAFLGWVDVPIGNNPEYNSVILNVPVSEKMLVEVRGLFYSPQLIKDTDSNYWSTMHPLLLISAAQRMMEVTNRNTQGLNDWDNVITTYNTQLGMDLIEEEIAELDQIRG